MHSVLTYIEAESKGSRHLSVCQCQSVGESRTDVLFGAQRGRGGQRGRAGGAGATETDTLAGKAIGTYGGVETSDKDDR